MTLIDKAEALRIVMEECYKDREMKLATRIEERITALPARGVGVTWHPFDTAPRDGSRFLAQGGGLDAVDICSYNARVGCWDCGAVTLDDTDNEPEGYNRPAQWMPIAALEPAIEQPSDAAPKLATPQPGEVLASSAPAPTDAAQAREAALLADIARGPMEGELMEPWINRMKDRANAILRALEGKEGGE